MEKHSRIFVAGEKKIAGPAIVRRLEELGYDHILNRLAVCPDLTRAESVEKFFEEWKPEYVFVASGPPGGILANLKYPVQFSRENLLAAAHVLEASHRHSVRKLIYLGTSCMYPRGAAQPLKPEYLNEGAMEPSSRAHSTARLACIELCLAYRAQFNAPFWVAIPSDIFGPEDHFDREDSHVVSALIVKMHEAKSKQEPSVTLLGSGRPVRDFIFSRDLADACIFLMNSWQGQEILNISAHQPLAISALAEQIKTAVGYDGKIYFRNLGPDGTPEKRLDAGPLFQAGWKPFTPMREALRQTYEGYLQKLKGPFLIQAQGTR